MKTLSDVIGNPCIFERLHASNQTNCKGKLPAAKGAVKMVEADQVEELVNLLKNEAKVI